MTLGQAPNKISWLILQSEAIWQRNTCEFCYCVIKAIFFNSVNRGNYTPTSKGCKSIKENWYWMCFRRSVTANFQPSGWLYWLFQIIFMFLILMKGVRLTVIIFMFGTNADSRCFSILFYTNRSLGTKIQPDIWKPSDTNPLEPRILKLQTTKTPYSLIEDKFSSTKLYRSTQHHFVRSAISNTYIIYNIIYYI